MNENNNNDKKFRGEIVKKDNLLNEGIYTLDTAEKYKLMLLMVAQISTKDEMPKSPEEIANRTYSFYIEDYAGFKDVKDKYWFENYVSDMVQYLKDKTAITIRSENRIETFWVFDNVVFEKDMKGIKVSYRFTYSISKYLFELREKFLAYHIRNIMPMRSKYSIRLYELLKQYEKIGERIFKIDEFREKVGTRVFIVDNKTGQKKILQDDYKDFRDLKKWVIEKAVEEINEYSDIEITKVEYGRDGRKIGFIAFYFQPKMNFNFQKVEEAKKEILEKPEEMPEVMEITWRSIGELRKYYKNRINEILEYMSGLKSRGQFANSLSENEILFLFVNADKDIYDDDIITSIIKKAISNKALKSPMGFLIKALNIDMDNAKFMELVLTQEKIDEKLSKQMLKKAIASGKSVAEYLNMYINEVVEPKVENELVIEILKRSFSRAVYSEVDNRIYIPAQNIAVKNLIENYYLKEMKKFLEEKLGMSDFDIVVEVQ